MLCSRQTLVALACGGLLMLSLCGCDSAHGGSAVTKENADKITVGMSESQVAAILGKPAESAEITLPDPLASLGGKLPEGVELPKNGKQSVWCDGGRTMTVTFAGDKVVGKSFSDSSLTKAEPSVPAGTKTDLAGVEPFTQSGSLIVIENEQGVVNFAFPYVLPPNVEIKGDDERNVVLTETKATGFKWKGVGTVHFGGKLTWTAKGIKATKIPEVEGK